MSCRPGKRMRAERMIALNKSADPSPPEGKLSRKLLRASASGVRRRIARTVHRRRLHGTLHHCSFFMTSEFRWRMDTASPKPERR